MKKADQLRFGLMGLAKPDSQRTERQRRLRTIVMCAPITRRFRPGDHASWKREQSYHADRLHFIRTNSYDALIALAAELVETDAELSDAQDPEWLERAEP